MNDTSAPLFAVGLTRTYGRLEALVDLDLTIREGECVALIGANGSGKSTAVRMMAGLLEPTAGAVHICGWDPHTEPDAELARGAIAVVPDNPLLYEDLSVRRHLELVALAHGVAGDGLDGRIDALLERLGLSARADFLPAELSRGMRQKVVIACGLVRPATTLLFDEPLTGLDPLGIRRMRETIVARGRAGAAILLSSHLLHLVQEICTRVVVMDHGRKIADGTVAELAARADLAHSGSSLEQIFLRVTGNDASA